MHFAFLFNWVQKPWLTQRWSRAIVSKPTVAAVLSLCTKLAARFLPGSTLIWVDSMGEVQRATLNGKVLDSFKFPASELLKGGQLVLEMGAEPNTSWGLKQ